MDSNKYKKDIKATIMNQIVRILTGPLLLLIIPIYLNPVEQGYWYTFGSLAALAVFADLGFSNIVLQFAAHEFAFLKFGSGSKLYGDSYHIWRLSSFFRFAMKWSSMVTLIVFPLILVFGFFFLGTKGNDVNWQYAWIIYSIASALAFMNSIIFSFFEGCDSVKFIQLTRMKMSFVNACSILILLFLKTSLYALSISLMTTSFLGFAIIVTHHKNTISQMLVISKYNNYDWKGQFLPLMWRYAISWSSGYFIFQLFTPLAFKFHGAEYSGKIGISIAMWTAGFGIAMSWINAVVPSMNMCIEKKEWSELDRIFNKGLKRAFLTMTVGGGLFLIFEYFLFDRIYFFSRVLPVSDMIVLYICWLGQILINGMAIYLRSHKKEPLMKISFIVALYISITTYFLALYFPSKFFMCGFLSSLIFWIPVVSSYFINERRNHRIISEV